MNRTTVWVLGTISGVILVLAILGPFGLGAGYGMARGCVTPDGAPPCTPTLYEVNFSFGPALRVGIGFLLLGVLIGLPAWIASPIFAARRGASSKSVILPLAVISVALLFVSIYFAAFNEVLTSPKTCFGADHSSCVTGPSAGWVALLGVLLAPVLLSYVVNLPAWIMALVRTARIRAWGWFVAVLLLPPWTTLLYGFLGPEQERPRASDIHPPAQGQPATA